MTKHQKACDEVKVAIEHARKALASKDDVTLEQVARMLDEIEWVQEEVLGGW